MPKIKFTAKRQGQRVWAWFLKQGKAIVAGGYGPTKRDSKSDARHCLPRGETID